MTPRTYIDAEDGAVTVDWVLLTAGLIGLALGVMALLAEPFRTQSSNLERQLQRDDIICTGFCARPVSSVPDAPAGEVEEEL